MNARETYPGVGSYDATKALDEVSAGQSRAVWGKGVPMQVRCNVTGALFVIVGPIHGPRSAERAERMIDAIEQVNRA